MFNSFQVKVLLKHFPKFLSSFKQSLPAVDLACIILFVSNTGRFKEVKVTTGNAFAG